MVQPANIASFPGGTPPPQLYLAARGFDKNGNRSGGLTVDMKVVTIPRDAHLVRLHDGKWPFGAWWLTPAEYRKIARYFGISARTLATGRSAGQSVLHAVLVLLSEWYGGRPDQLGRFTLIRTRAPFLALYGPGDVAMRQIDDAPLKTVSPALLRGESAARQVFLPDLGSHLAHVDIVAEGFTDTTLHVEVSQARARRLPFE